MSIAIAKQNKKFPKMKHFWHLPYRRHSVAISTVKKEIDIQLVLAPLMQQI